MNLTLPHTPRPRESRPVAPANQATVYTRGGHALRIPLRPAPGGRMAGCGGHPEEQLLRWLQRRAAAEPGFPVRVRSILLLVSSGGCPACQERLRRFLNRQRLGTRLRLVSTGYPGNTCRCGCRQCTGGTPAQLVLDEVLGEDGADGLPPTPSPAASPPVPVAPSSPTPASPAPASPTPASPTPASPAPPAPDKHRSPEFRKSKADLKRGSIDDPDLPRHLRGWMKQERNQRGSNPRRWRNPPGMDVGHVDPTNNKRVRWEESGQNRSRGARFKREIGAELTGEAPGPAPAAVIHPNIDVHAQYALQRLLSSPSLAERADGTLLLTGVRNGALRGIFKEDQYVPARWAKDRGLGWWQLLDRRKPKQGAAVLLYAAPATPATWLPPLIVFRDSLRSNPALLDALLRAAARTLRQLRSAKLANPALTPPQAWAQLTGTPVPPGSPARMAWAIFRFNG